MVFCKVSNPSVYTWQAIISAHAAHGQNGIAICLFHIMQEEGLQPNRFIFSCILKACSSLGALGEGHMIHGQIIRCGINVDVVVGNTLIDLYCKCGRLEEACRVFHELPLRTVVSWSVMIAGYVQHGYYLLAFELFEQMQYEGVKPNKVTILCILKACGGVDALWQGRLIHGEIVGSGFESDVFVGNTLIDMYAKCGRLEDARIVFDLLSNRSVVSWGAMIAGYTLHGDVLPAIDLFEKMQLEGMQPDKRAFLSILKACGSFGDLEQAKLIHKQINKSGLELDVVVGSMLVDMYAKCGSLDGACEVFDKLANRNTVTWGAIIAGYADHGEGFHALKGFVRMQEEGIKPDKVTYLCCLKACGAIGALEQGKLIHKQMLISGLESDVVVSSTLLDMYGKCGSLEEARKCFDRLPERDVVCWNTIISAYAQHDQVFPAIELFQKMQLEGIKPDGVLFSCILRACGSKEAIGHGKLIHEQTINSGFDTDVIVGNALIDMYVSCGHLEEAATAFNKLSHPDIVSWGLMIAGYADHGHDLAAVRLFKKMHGQAMEPNSNILLSILKACSGMGALDMGRLIHNQIMQCRFELDMVVGSSLLDMYAKCGRLEDACKVFGKLPSQDVVSWGAMIMGYAQHGDHRMARQCIEDMQQHGIKPNETVYLGLLSACSQAGKVDEAHSYFMAMGNDHGMAPTIEHFNCMVDLLGRTGRLYEAQHLMQSMPVPSDITGWISLLTACKTYGSINLGRHCFDQIVHLDPNFAAAHVLMCNIYANAHMWDDFH